MKGMRNVVAHHYGSISLEIVWNTVKQDLPGLWEFCNEMLKKSSDGE